MGQDRVKSWLMSVAMAFSATLAIFYVVILAGSLLQPVMEATTKRADPERDFRDSDRDWNRVNNGYVSLKDLYTMTLVVPESPSRGQLLRRSAGNGDR